MFMYLFLFLLSGWLELSDVIPRSTVQLWISWKKVCHTLVSIKIHKMSLNTVSKHEKNHNLTPNYLWYFTTNSLLKKMQWNNSLPDKTLSVSNEGMNAKKVKKIKFHSTEQMDKCLYKLQLLYGKQLWSCNISIITMKLSILTKLLKETRGNFPS